MLKDILYSLGLYKARWEDLFPDATQGDEPTPGIKREPSAGSCDVCGSTTSWRNTVTDTWICSHRCRMRALRALQRKPGEILEKAMDKIRRSDDRR